MSHGVAVARIPDEDLESEYMEAFSPEIEDEMVARGLINLCVKCGCTDLRACVGGCVWATATLCSRCV